MKKIGFVYVLGNETMPNLQKVGCTENSPHLRAHELSKATGVPTPFEVLCYIEVADYLRVEQALHKYLEDHRESSRREFFRSVLHKVVPWLYHHPNRLAFCECIKRPNPPLLLDPDLLGNYGWSYGSMPNPWEEGEGE